MDENAWIANWSEVYDDIFLVGSPAMKNRPKPTDAHLDRLEKRLGFSLPRSYKAFVKVFGPGRLAQSVVIYAPGYHGKNVIDFLGNNNWQEYEAERRNISGGFKNLFSLGSLAYQEFVWDTDLVTNQDEHEYEIFFLPQELNEPLVKICDSFSTFVEYYCMTGEYWKLLGSEPVTTWEDEETGEIHSMRCFEPIGQSPNSNI